MRTVMRFILLSLVVAPIAYWLLGGGLLLPSLSANVAGPGSICEHVDWYLAPGNTGQRQWVPAMERTAGGAQIAEWKNLTDAERGTVLVQCGKERR